MNPCVPILLPSLWLGSLWLVVTFCLLLLPLCLHLWHSRILRGRSRLLWTCLGRRKPHILFFVFVFWAYFFGPDNYWVVFAGAGVVTIILFLS